MGNSQSIFDNCISFDNMKNIVKNTNGYLIINTLASNEQNCLIVNTTPIDKEEYKINEYLNIGEKNICIVIYGKNCNDKNVIKKYNQLNSLGFNNIKVYFGGLFEWLLLQDIYGYEHFKTTSKEPNILRFGLI